MTVRAWFRQLRAADFARAIAVETGQQEGRIYGAVRWGSYPSQCAMLGDARGHSWFLLARQLVDEHTRDHYWEPSGEFPVVRPIAHCPCCGFHMLIVNRRTGGRPDLWSCVPCHRTWEVPPQWIRAWEVPFRWA